MLDNQSALVLTQNVDFYARQHNLAALQDEVQATVMLIAKENHPDLRQIFTDQLKEALVSIQSLMLDSSDMVRVVNRERSVDIPRQKITALGILPLRDAGNVFEPVIDMRMRTADTPIIKVFTPEGLVETPGPGRWFRFKLQDVRLYFVEP